MAQVNMGAAIGAGFGLIRRHPLSVLAWGAWPVLVQVTTLLLFAPVFVAIYTPYVIAAQTHALPVTPAMTPQLLQAQLWLQLLNLAQLLVSAIINCAVFRAILHPERAAFAYMRLGITELLIVALMFIAIVAFFVITLIVMIPVGVMIGILVAVSHGSPEALAIVIPVTIVALLLAGAFLFLRFALAGPMIVDDGKFHLFDAWVLSRGHFWSMFAVAICVLLIGLVVEILIFALLIAIGVAGVGAIAGGLANAPSLLALPPATLVQRLAPVLAVYLVLAVPLFGAMIAFFGAPWARILRDLKPVAAEVFA